MMISLTKNEFALLEDLLLNRGHAISRATLLERIWNMHGTASTNVVDVYVNYLRRKLPDYGSHALIGTVRGEGYAVGLRNDGQKHASRELSNFYVRRIRMATSTTRSITAAPRTAALASADISFRQRVRDALTGLRWQVREAAGGAEALAHLDASPAETVILDSWLPDLEIQEFIAEFEKLHPGVDLVTRMTLLQDERGRQSETE